MSDLDLRQRLSRPVWIAAAIGALALHAGGIAFAISTVEPDAATELGAPAIEIGIELAAPHVDPNNLPVGPDTEAAAASPAAVSQKAELEHSDLPKAKPTETDDPDRVVAPDATKKPQDEPVTPTVQTTASVESAASEETATPSVTNAQEALRSVAPTPGSGESAQRQRVTWEKELAVHFNKFKRYPADRAARSAEVVVSFVLDRLGHVVSRRIVKGSGDTAFDNAALDMLQRSDPVPPPPPVVADDGLTFSLPVIFHVKKAEKQ